MFSKSKINKLTCIIIFVLISFLIYKTSFYRESPYSFTHSYDFSSNWEMHIEGSDINKIINLPYNTRKNPVENTISIENIIPKDFVGHPYIRIGSSQQSFKVYVENKLVYNFESMRKFNDGKTGGAVWKIVELPKDSIGKKIRIEFKSSYLQTSGYLSKIKLGTKDQLLHNLFQDAFKNELIVMLAVLFLILFIIYINIKLNMNLKLVIQEFYFLLLSILDVLLWISCESQLFIFIHNNYVLNYVLEHLSLFSFPIFLYKFLIVKYKLKPENLIKNIYILHIILFVTLILCQYVGVLTFFESQWIFLLVLFITLFIVILSIAYQCRKDIRLKFLLKTLSIVFISLLLDYFLYDIKETKIKIDFLSLGIFIIVILIIINTWKEFCILNEDKAKKDYLEMQLKQQLCHYTLMEENNFKLRRYRHDMINHWMVINNLIKNRKIDWAKEYCTNMIEEFINIDSAVINTGNPVIDAIFTEKIKKMKDLNIEVNTDIMISKSLKIESIDCCIIFANILDNAIEACCKLKNKKYINITLKSNKNNLICKVENSMDNLVLDNFKTTKKDKSLHGFGLMNIKKAIEKYSGNIDIEYDESHFKVGFILYNV